MKWNNEANKEKAGESTEEEGKFVQSTKELANMEENELKRRRDRLL